MTLFTLLIVIALERVVVKSKSLHISTLANQYFNLVDGILPKPKQDELSPSPTLTMLLVAAAPALIVWALVAYLPALFVFILYLFVLWVCLGCPLTRQTYKRYLQAANREDFQACSLYSEQFGNKGGNLANVGIQLVYINYRHYASVIIFFVLLGLPGMVFYALCKEWHLLQVTNAPRAALHDEVEDDYELEQDDQGHAENEQSAPSLKNVTVIEQDKVLFILDWLPVRITTFGFLLVGHFSRALPAWLETFTDAKLNAFDVLAKVAKASEEFSSRDKPHLQEPLQMVKLVKRNIIFLLMVISVMTLVGVVS